MKKLLSLALAALLALTVTACGGAKSDPNTIRIGASVTPHAEILNQVKPILEEQGYTVDLVEYNDYVLPNTATDSGEIDANYFQHNNYMNNFNAENKTKLVSVADIHYEPLGIYAGKTKSLSALKNGASVAVPNDPTNEARALLLLEAQGLIKLKEGAGISATKLDIVENKLNLDIKEIEAAQLVRSLPDVDLAVINGNYALEGKLKIADALAIESAASEAVKEFANIICVKKGNEDLPKIKALVEALKSDTISAFIESTYGGAVVVIK